MSSVAARFSPDRVYRYRLERRVSATPTGSICFILLNPSTADEANDDPTIRRCIGYARSWGFSRLVVVNLFAFRATDPRDLRKVDDPFGPGNWSELFRAAVGADLVVGGWGAHGSYLNAGRNLVALLRKRRIEIKALGLTKKFEPVHPLYQRGDLKAEITL